MPWLAFLVGGGGHARQMQWQAEVVGVGHSDVPWVIIIPGGKV